MSLCHYVTSMCAVFKAVLPNTASQVLHWVICPKKEFQSFQRNTFVMVRTQHLCTLHYAHPHTHTHTPQHEYILYELMIMN